MPIDAFFTDLRSNGVEFGYKDTQEIVKRFEIDEGGELPYRAVIHHIVLNGQSKKWGLKRPDLMP